MFDCIHVRKTGYQNFGKQLKIAFETRDFCINLGPKLVKIRLIDSAEQLLYLVSQWLSFVGIYPFSTKWHRWWDLPVSSENKFSENLKLSQENGNL